MYNLFLDDIRYPNMVKGDIYKKDIWTIIRNYDEFIKFIEKNGIPNIISFDHDLADEHYAITSNKKTFFKEKTGYEAVKWLCNYSLDNNLKLPIMLFHSANYVGKKNMEMYYKNFIKHYPHLLNNSLK